MMNWITSSKRKKHQRAINKVIQRMNKNIYDDDLWLGRFYARIHHTEWRLFEDGSGGELYCWIELVDKKTKQTKMILDTANHFRFGATMFMAMNDFIVEDVDVWSEKPTPCVQNAEDFRNVR